MDNILQKINKSGIKLLKITNPEKTYAVITEEASKLVGAKYGSILLYDNEKLKRIYSSNEIISKMVVHQEGSNLFKTLKEHQVISPDTAKEKNEHPEFEKLGVKSTILAPILLDGKSIGIISLFLTKYKNFTKEEIEMFKLFGSMVSFAVKKAQLYQEVETIKEERDLHISMEYELEKIHNSSIKFLEPHPLDEIYKVIVNEAIKLSNADFGSIFIKNEDGLKRVYSTTPVFYTYRVRKDGYTHKSFITHKPLIVGIEKTGKLHPEIKKLNIKSTFLIPLFYKNESIGVLSLDLKNSKVINKNKFEIMKLFASIASLSIRNSQLYNETRKSLELRDLFISLASHELRTPLTTLNGYTQLLYRKMADQDTNEGKWIRQIHEELGRLTNLVKELLQINRIKSGQLQYTLRECNLKDVILRAADNARFNNPHRDIYIESNISDSKSWIVGDYEKLLQVFTNLLDNALKFSKKDDLVSIFLNTNKSDLVALIKDQGRGIDKEDLTRIFGEFYKGKNRNEEGGMGIGLYLAKSIIEKHHGTIKVQSKLNYGTTIKIILPQKKV